MPSPPPPPRDRHAFSPCLGVVAFALAWLALAALIVWKVDPQVLGGALLDTDSYMRMVRVRLLAETGAWFDGSIPRSNWPYGETLHWTRPLDLLILTGGWLLAPFVGFPRALHLSGVVIAPLLLLALALAASWAVRPLAGSRGRYIVMLAVLVQPLVVGYSRAGRPDHHPLLLLAFVLGLGFWMRALGAGGGAGAGAGDRGDGDPAGRRGGGAARMASGPSGVDGGSGARGRPERATLLAGVVAAGGLWVSPEYLVALAVLLAGGVIAWLRSGSPVERFNLRFAAALAAATAVALVLERGPGLLQVAYERISVVHVLVTVLALGFWVAVTALAARGSLASVRARLGVAALGAAICFGVLGLAFPGFFRGPMVSFQHPVVRFWLSNVSELQAHLVPDDRQGVALFVTNLGAAVFVLPYLVVRWVREPGEGAWRARLLVLLSWAAFLPLALAQIRWATYVQLLVAMGLGEVVASVRGRLAVVRGGAARDLARAGAVSALLVGPFLLGVMLDSSAEAAAPPDPAAEAPGQPCDYTQIARYLARDPALGGRARTVAAIMDAGPALLYLSPHRVLATPYANEAGMVASWELMNATDPDRARQIAAVRQVELVLLCPARERGFFVSTDVAGDTTLYGWLLSGRPPSWLSPLALPDSIEGARLFQVR